MSLYTEKGHPVPDDAAIAHRSEEGRDQALSEHLRNVAQRAGEFAAVFGAESWGRASGLLHDDGKASPAFQRRIRGASVRVDHSTPGAKYATENLKAPKGFGKLLAYCVAGHHSGLPDGNAGDDETCLTRRLARGEPGSGYLAAELPSTFESPPIPKPPAPQSQRGFAGAFFVRMVFSCLVDADFLDTEAFLQPEKAEKRPTSLDLAALKQRLDIYLSELCAKAELTEVNRLRARILDESRAAAHLAPGLFSLTVPTGGGKTLSSMAFALEHALLHGLRRIIYVIPYTSIIEQTAQVFRYIFGSEAVLEHHSNFVQENEGGDDEIEERRRLVAQNWDASIVVTTNVQFFESFFANRTSKTRKLHNVAKSVVILDEAQMLPVPVLRPTMEMIRESQRPLWREPGPVYSYSACALLERRFQRRPGRREGDDEHAAPLGTGLRASSREKARNDNGRRYRGVDAGPEAEPLRRQYKEARATLVSSSRRGRRAISPFRRHVPCASLSSPRQFSRPGGGQHSAEADRQRALPGREHSACRGGGRCGLSRGHPRDGRH